MPKELSNLLQNAPGSFVLETQTRYTPKGEVQSQVYEHSGEEVAKRLRQFEICGAGAPGYSFSAKKAGQEGLYIISEFKLGSADKTNMYPVTLSAKVTSSAPIHEADFKRALNGVHYSDYLRSVNVSEWRVLDLLESDPDTRYQVLTWDEKGVFTGSEAADTLRFYKEGCRGSPAWSGILRREPDGSVNTVLESHYETEGVMPLRVRVRGGTGLDWETAHSILDPV